MKDGLRNSDIEIIADEDDISNLKPNFSELARQLGRDRHTLSNHWHNGYPTYNPSNPRKSKFDDYTKEISIAFTKTDNVMAVFQYMNDKYPDVFNAYTSFKGFVDRRDLRPTRIKIPHVLYETEEGFQAQLDWKENLKMIFSDGTLIVFHLLVITFSFSRMHFFEFSFHKTFEEICRCMTAVFRRAGGIPISVLTDNMSALLTYDKTGFNARTKQFLKDMGFDLTRCKPRHPFTKGKIESPNRFVEWLQPYQDELKSADELIEKIYALENKVNKQNNRTTGLPPQTLFVNEKEVLKPLPGKRIIDSYMNGKEVKVHDTLLFKYDDADYSMPEKYIGKQLYVSECNDCLYVYDGAHLLRPYQKQKSKSINYMEEEYVDALAKSMPEKPKDEIRSQARKNLEMLSGLGNQYEDNNKNE